MDISKKSRTELKAYFIKNAVPTESNFRDLIDGVLVHKDDGITKSQDAPLCVEAQSSGDRPIVHLYDSFASTSPNFVLSLLPGTTSGDTTLGRGLSIGNGAGAGSACLYIDKDQGTVGIGTVTPGSYKLAVAGTMGVSGLLTANTGITLAANQHVTISGTGLYRHPTVTEVVAPHHGVESTGTTNCQANVGTGVVAWVGGAAAWLVPIRVQVGKRITSTTFRFKGNGVQTLTWSLDVYKDGAVVVNLGAGGPVAEPAAWATKNAYGGSRAMLADEYVLLKATVNGAGPELGGIAVGIDQP
ncbi:MAG TPA: hypothetical protein PLV92_17930 [Pirellulaceae bacterium]|nr:hypothetical protein [Pirellulaceae bacterium]